MTQATATKQPHRLRVTLPPLHRRQREVADNPARFKVLACGRRWGKTRLGAALCVMHALKGRRAWWVGPSYPVASIGWRQIKRLAQQIPNTVIRESDRLVTFPGGGWVQVRSADNPDSLRGEGLDFVVIDECAFIQEEAWTEALRPALSDRLGGAMFISTPKGRNWFWRLWQRGKVDGGEWASWQLPTTDNPFIDPAEVAAACATLPDNVVAQEYHAEFIEDGASSFSPLWWEGRARYDAKDKGLVNACIGRWISWDTAIKDTDTAAFSACTVAEMTPDYRLLVREVWRDRLGFPDLVAIMEEKAHEYNRDGKLRGVIIEDKASGTSAYQTLRAGTNQGLAALLIPFMPHGSKEQRASQAGVWCKHGCVELPHPSDKTPWLFPFEQELFSFPLSDYADQVDSFSQLILYTEHLLAEGWHARGGMMATE
jgi:predicted phage terminase large subunit-like protein